MNTLHSLFTFPVKESSSYLTASNGEFAVSILPEQRVFLLA